jgi:hypothetical protein
MDLLVLLPLEFLANFPAHKPVLETSGSKKRVPAKSSAAQVVEEEDASGELDVKAKLRFEFAKLPALLALKPN